MVTSISTQAKRLVVAVLAVGLIGSAPVLAQETPAAGDSPQPALISADDSGEVLTHRDGAVLLAGAMGLPDAIWQGLFSDVAETSPDAATIEALALAGVVKGNIDGTFRPDEPLTRGRFAVWLDRAFFPDRYPTDLDPFTDIPEGAAYEDAANGLFSQGITRGCAMEPLRFCGEDVITRGEVETLIGRALDLPYTISDCEDPDEWLLLCEVYEYIDTQYLLGTTDEELAAPVTEAAIRVLDEAEGSDARRPRFDCAIPDMAFEALCAWAWNAVDTPLRSLAETAVRQMVTALDRNSAYHDPEEWRELEERGRYVGIGVRVITVDDQWKPFCTPLSDTCRIFILEVFEGGPAAKAGLMPWDFIVAVDGNRLHDLTLREAADLIRG
ncbi:MAG: S-layer homology domain-containing protein [bacterium]|nr:S-layer homology domain-containing protein [bacterium]